MHSLSQTLDLTCGQCGRALAFELWLIVDAGERPDLLDRARAGDLHTVTCPICGPQGAIDAPLLLYLPDHDPATGQPPLIFSPAAQTTAEQDQQMAAGLLRELAARLGDAWQEAWLAQVASVRRDLLPVALSDDPAAAMREHLAQEGERGRQGEGEPEEDAELPPAIAAELRSMLATLAAEGVTVDSPEDLARVLAERPELAARLEAAMRAAMMEEDDADAAAADGDDDGDDSDAAETLPDLLNRFIGAESWDESQRIVEAHPELLSDAADERMALALEEYADNPDAVQLLTEHRVLLRRCRAAGIARAFAEPMLGAEGLAEAERLGLAPEEFLAQVRAAQQTSDPAVPPAFAADLRAAQEGEQRYRRTGDLAALDTAAAAWARILDAPGFTTADTRFRLAVLNNAGGVFLLRYWASGRIDDLNRALAGWEQAVKLTPPDSSDRSALLNNLGAGLRSRYARTGRLEDLEAAIGTSEQAVKLTPPDSPARPIYLNNLGSALGDRFGRM
jgi:tetratricopeptide (TPR) repeat protein